MENFECLELISLSRNFLKDISFLQTDKLKTLLDLDLSNNKISILKAEHFENLLNLNVLNLEDNLIEKVRS